MGTQEEQTQQDTDSILKTVMPAVTAMGEIALMGIAGIAGSLAQKIAEVSTSSNIEIQNVEGNESLKVTDNDTSMDKNSVSGTDNNGTLAKDEVNGNDGSLDASTLDGKAVSTESSALDNNAGAVITQGGVLDTSSEAMKLNG